jgi:hypothetical protein
MLKNIINNIVTGFAAIRIAVVIIITSTGGGA